MDARVDFKSDGFVFNVDGNENFHEYSPFFPYDITKIITPELVPYGAMCGNSTSTSVTYSSNLTYPTTSWNPLSTPPDFDVYNTLIEKLTPLFIKKSFKYWNYEPFTDKVMKLFNHHKSVFATNSDFTKTTDNNCTEEESLNPRFRHNLYSIYEIFPTSANSGLSSPFIFLLSLIHTDKEKEYFLDDLLKFPVAKTVYILEQILKETFPKELTDNPIFSYIKTHGIDSIKRKETENLFDRYSDIIRNMPNSIDRFPLYESCHVPTLSVYPETEFQWALVNNYMISNRFALNTTELTHVLLPYIQASEKAVELYKNIRAEEHNTWRIYVDNSCDKKYELSGMLMYIEDGKQIYERYKGHTVEKEGRLLRMKEIKGSFLKQIKNSIYNHNIEKKMSIEEKLQLLLSEKTEPDMPIDIELSEVLEDHRIKTKKEIIILGKELGHCLGTKVDSKDLFFRLDTVCLQVSIEDKRVVQCRDIKNSITDKSKAFELFICEEFAKININLNEMFKNSNFQMVNCAVGEFNVANYEIPAMNIANPDAIVNGEGNADDDNGDNPDDVNIVNVENNQYNVYNAAPNITFNSDWTPSIELKVTVLKLELCEDGKMIECSEHYISPQVYEGTTSSLTLAVR